MVKSLKLTDMNAIDQETMVTIFRKLKIENKCKLKSINKRRFRKDCQTDNLKIARFRDDGVIDGTPTRILFCGIY